MILCSQSYVRLTAFALVLLPWFPVVTGAVESNTIETHYVYSTGGQLLAEYEDGVCVKEYIYSGGRKLVAEYLPQEDRYLYYTADQIGSTRMVTDQAGEVVHSAAYGPYGDRQTGWNKLEKPKPGFSGKEREAWTDLDYFEARYYNNYAGRFLSPDPITTNGNLYAYSGNNPINYVDPDGRKLLSISANSSDKFFGEYTYDELIEMKGNKTDSFAKEIDLFLEAWEYKSIHPSIRGHWKLRNRLESRDSTPVKQAFDDFGAELLGFPLLFSPSGAGKRAIKSAMLKASFCFVAGTLVATASGDKPIELIQVGDKVWSYNHDSGLWSLKEVEASHSHRYQGDIVTIWMRGERIEATGNHPFWIVSGEALAERPGAEDVPATERGQAKNGRWIEARYLRSGDEFLSLTNKSIYISSIEQSNQASIVYNLSVSGHQNYCISSSRVLVHNKSSVNQSLLKRFMRRCRLGGEACSEANTQLFLNRNMKVLEYIDKFRKGGIKEVIPREALDLTLEQALIKGKINKVNVRKLLLDSRDKFTK